MNEYLQALQELLTKIEEINHRLDSVKISMEASLDTIKNIVNRVELENQVKSETQHND